jgi:hypothetical protein
MYLKHLAAFGHATEFVYANEITSNSTDSFRKQEKLLLKYSAVDANGMNRSNTHTSGK